MIVSSTKLILKDIQMAGHSINFANALGIHPRALSVRSARAEILANNLANDETPGFKARDLDFKGILNGEYEKIDRLSLTRTNAKHIPAEGIIVDSELKYRTPHQPAVDGNTVEADIEKGHFAKNNMDFQASFSFLDSKFKGLTKALRD